MILCWENSQQFKNLKNIIKIYKSLMDEEKKRPQEETFNVGPFSLLTKSVKANN